MVLPNTPLHQFWNLGYPFQKPECILDRFTKKLFWNFKECQLVSMEACLAEQMSEKNFVPNVAPSLGSSIIFFGRVQGVSEKSSFQNFQANIYRANLLGHLGPFGPCWTTLSYFGQYWAVWATAPLTIPA